MTPDTPSAGPTLKECPFNCVGGGTRTVQFFAAFDGSDSLSFVQCSCGAEGPHAYTEDGAIAAWNATPAPASREWTKDEKYALEAGDQALHHYANCAHSKDSPSMQEWAREQAATLRRLAGTK